MAEKAGKLVYLWYMESNKTGLILGSRTPAKLSPAIDEWVRVSSLKEFSDYIESYYQTNNGLPALISLSHDLTLEHTLAASIRLLHEKIDYNSFKEPTGKDVARWLCKFCEEKEINPKMVCVHEENNQLGRYNIFNYINSWKKSKGYSQDCFTINWEF